MNKLERAARAKQLLEDRTFKEVFAEIRQELVTAIEMVGMSDHETQHELVLSLQILNRHKRKLEQWVDDGKVEQAKLDQKNWIDRARQRWTG